MDKEEIYDLKMHRNDVQSIITESEKIIEDRLFALATGGLLASLTLYQIKPITLYVAKIFLCSSWALLGLAIPTILFSLVYAKMKNRKYMDCIDEKISGSKDIELAKIHKEIYNHIDYTNICSLILTTAGIVAFVISAAITLF